MIAYSMDLRKRIIDEVNSKTMLLKDIAKLYKVDAKTIYRWRQRLEKNGSYKAITGYQKGHSHKITDLEKFKNFVSNNPDLTLKEMAKSWGNVSARTIERSLKKINFTSKKTIQLQRSWSRKKKNIFS